MDFVSIGRHISSYVKLKTPETIIRLDKNGISELAQKNETLKGIIDDVFIGVKKPSIEFRLKDKNSETLGEMITRDGDEIVGCNSFVVKEKLHIDKLLSGITGKTQKITLDKDAIIRMADDNNEFSQFMKLLLNGEAVTDSEKRFINFIKQNTTSKDEKFYLEKYLQKVKNPSLEISVKNLKDGKISVFTLKDGDVVVAQGAFSDTVDRNGQNCLKYHISSQYTTSTGNVSNGKKSSKSIEKLNAYLLQAFNLFNEGGISGRMKYIMCHKFGLNGFKPASNEKIGYLFGLTRERVRIIINETKLRLLGKHINEQKIAMYERTKQIPKYLNKEEAEQFKYARIRAIDGDEDSISQIDTFFEINEMRAKKAAYNIIHDIPNPEPEVPIKVDEIFVINE